MKKTNRFKYYGKIVIKDKLFGSTMMMNVRTEAPTMKLLINNFNVKSKEAIRMMDKPRRVSQKAIDELVEQMREEGKSNRRIHNHFAKFDIEVYLPDDKKKAKLERWQKTLGDC